MTTNILGGVLSVLSFVSKHQVDVLAAVAYRSERFVLTGSTPHFYCERPFACRWAGLVIRIGHERPRAGVGCDSQTTDQE